MSFLASCLVLLGPAAVFVAPNGSDANPGSSSKPVATVQVAVDRARATGSKQIVIRAGTYRVSSSILLDSRDTGLTIVAAKGARPLISGGLAIPQSSVRPCQDEAILSRVIDRDARGHIMTVDLAKEEVVSFAAYGFPKPIIAGPNALYADGKLMTLARWPNVGFAHVKAVKEAGNGENDQDKPARKPTFTADSDRPKLWSNAVDAWLYGYWKFDWADESIRLDRVETTTGAVTLSTPHVYGVDPGTPFFAENLIEELDAPGEYFVDAAKKKLYFIPEKPGAPSDLVLAQVGTPLITIQGASNITLRGLDFAYGRGDGLKIDNSTNVEVEGCQLYDLGERGATIDGGRDSGLRGCNIWNTGEGGVSLSGGDRKTLTPSRNFVENCDIHDYQRRTQTYRPAVAIAGVGQIVRHCAMHDAPHSAIIFSGNDHVIEYNEFFRTISRTGDGGVVYTGRDWTARGTSISFNYFHDNIGINKWEPAIYLDDLACGINVRGNVIQHCHWGFLIGGGRDNMIEDNMIIDCASGFHCDARGLGWAAKSRPTMEERLAAVPYKEEPWRTRYPALVDILNQKPMAPAGNILRGNHLVKSGDFMADTEAPFKASAVYDGNDDKGIAPTKLPIGQMGLQNDRIRKTLLLNHKSP